MNISDKIIKAKIIEIVSSDLPNDEKVKSFEIFIEEIKIGSYISAYNEMSREKSKKQREQEQLVNDAKNKGKVVALKF